MIFFKGRNENHPSMAPPDYPQWGMTGHVYQMGMLKGFIQAITNGLNPPADDPLIHNAIMAPTIPQIQSPASIPIKPVIPPSTAGTVSNIGSGIPLNCPNCNADQAAALRNLLAQPGVNNPSLAGGAIYAQTIGPSNA
jgi:hypothetical protein